MKKKEKQKNKKVPTKKFRKSLSREWGPTEIGTNAFISFFYDFFAIENKDFLPSIVFYTGNMAMGIICHQMNRESSNLPNHI